MSLNWYFYKENAGWLLLECSDCGNDQAFEGINLLGHLIWKCSQCGNHLSLNLRIKDEARDPAIYSGLPKESGSYSGIS